MVEDDVESMQACCNAIRHILNDCKIYQAGNAEKAMEFMNRYPIDLFLIDINLPGMKGDMLAGKIRKNPMYSLTQIVFVTGIVRNEAELHKLYHHYEYVKKPFTVESFAADVGVLLQELNRMILERSTSDHQIERYLFIEDSHFSGHIKLRDLLCVEKLKGENGIHICTVQKEYTIFRKGLEDFIEEVNEPYFVRCHKSFAVNLRNVDSFSKSSRHIRTVNFANVKENVECLVGDTFYDEVLSLFQEYKTKEMKTR